MLVPLTSPAFTPRAMFDRGDRAVSFGGMCPNYDVTLNEGCLIGAKPAQPIYFREGRTRRQDRNRPLQPGDVAATYVDVSDPKQDIGFEPNVPIEEGTRRLVSWFRNHYCV